MEDSIEEKQQFLRSEIKIRGMTLINSELF